VGRATAESLAKIGLYTIGDAALADPAVLVKALKPAMGRSVHERANGIDDSPVIKAEESESKVIGHSDTTPDDVVTEEGAQYFLLSQSERVGMRLRKAGKRAGVVTVQLKNSAFKTYSHQKKLPATISSASDIYKAALELFSEMWRGDALRLLGISLSDLRDASSSAPDGVMIAEDSGVYGLHGDAGQQLTLFDSIDPVSAEEEEKKKNDQKQKELLDETQDRIRERFGKDAITRATLKNKKDKA